MYCTILYDVSTVCGIHKYRHMYIYTYNVCTCGVWVREREGREGRGKGKGGERGGEGSELCPLTSGKASRKERARGQSRCSASSVTFSSTAGGGI